MTGILIVTGASRGIGAACARLAGQRGYKVCVNYKNSADKAAAVVREIEAGGGQALAVQADVSKDDDVARLFKTVDDAYGRLTALINNAGIITRPYEPIDSITEQALNDLWAGNITSMLLCAREAFARMSTAKGGSGGAVVNITSAAAKLGGGGQFVDYAASKGAVEVANLARISRHIAGVTAAHLPTGKEKCAARCGTTGKRFDAACRQRRPALRVAPAGSPAASKALTVVPATLCGLLLAGRPGGRDDAPRYGGKYGLGLAQEGAPQGIRVNGVRPGLIATDFHELTGIEDRVGKLGPTVPLGRAGTAEEVAQAALWLLSAEASYVAGTIVDVTGGR